jgi:hypothetical protein
MSDMLQLVGILVNHSSCAEALELDEGTDKLKHIGHCQRHRVPALS